MRSSPQKTKVCAQGKHAFQGVVARRRYRARGVLPPERATTNRPRRCTLRQATASNRRAAACTARSEVGKMRTKGHMAQSAQPNSQRRPSRAIRASAALGPQVPFS